MMEIPTGGVRYLYVPEDDPEALGYFSDARATASGIEVARRTVTGHGYSSICSWTGRQAWTPEPCLDPDAKWGLCRRPLIVPGGRFNEMYGWDSYFHVLGLLEDHRIDLAKALTENLVYELAHYGKILNGNRTYYLTRSQPPFLTSMGLTVYEHLPKNDEAKTWLAGVFRAAIKEYYTVWMSKPRLTDTGLSRFYGEGLGPSPEVETGHFDAIYRPYAEERKLDARTFEEKYKAGEFEIPTLDRFFVHDRCVRESGHDTTYRWDWQGDRCADFVTVDLNSLLYKTEVDIAQTIETIFDGTLRSEVGSEETSAAWYARAKSRRS